MATTLKVARFLESAAKPCKIALVGFGTVGSSVARLLSCRNGELPFQLTHVHNRDVARKKVDWVADEVQWTDDFDDLLNSDAEVIVEQGKGHFNEDDQITTLPSALAAVLE